MDRHDPGSSRTRTARAWLISFAFLALAEPAVAEPGPLFYGEDVAPLPPSARSVWVSRPEEPLFAEASCQSA